MFPTLKQLGNFTIQRVLGRGGMGVVYLATDERLGRPVALKVLDVYDIPDDEQRSRFIREARSAAAIRHPNIATIYEVGETPDGFPFIAMEYCDGLTLAQLIRRGPVLGGVFLSIAKQIADGVAAAHRNGVVHRDIKSANIVLQDDGTVKILDFGLAKRFEQTASVSATAKYSTTGSTFFGTLPYIAPEQASGHPADQRSDLFSVGVVFYELATGKLPFDDESPLMLLEKIRDAEPEPFLPADPNFSPRAIEMISRLLQKRPEDRYQRADELADDLRTITLEAHPPSIAPRAKRSATHALSRTIRRKPLSSVNVMMAITIAAVAVAVLAVLFVTRRQSAPKPSAVASGPIRSLAVLPFRNLSQSATDGFLSVGLADALVTKLQELPQLNVRPTSAVLALAKENVDSEKAASELQVDGVLEGHFISSGNQVRVNLQLTDARTGYGVWAGTVDGQRDNLILLLDQVSAKTATALNQRLGAKDKSNRSQPHTDNPEAFEAFLQSRALIGSLVPEQNAKQVEYLKKATDLDPRFAAAYADLAIALSLQRVRGFRNDTLQLQTPEWYARQAVRLDPNLPEAHLALGRALVRIPERFRESVRENLAALRLNANDPQALYTLATYFVATGDTAKAGCVGDVMARIDPSSNDVRARGYWNVNAVDPEGALQLASVALKYPETQLGGYDITALAQLMNGNIDAAEEAQRKAAELVPNHYIPKSLAALIAAARGDQALFEKHVKSFEQDADVNHWASLRVAVGYAKLGKKAEAIKWLNKTYELGNHNWYYLVKHPWLEPLKQEPEYQRILSRIKNELDDVRDDVVGVFELVCQQRGLAT